MSTQIKQATFYFHPRDEHEKQIVFVFDTMYTS